MQITTTFTVAKAGYYRAIAHATKVSDEPPFEDGVPVQEAAHDEVWFLITPEGGAVTTGFDQAAVPNDWQPVPGPARSRANVARPRSGDKQSIGATFNSMAAIDEFHGRGPSPSRVLLQP